MSNITVESTNRTRSRLNAQFDFLYIDTRDFCIRSNITHHAHNPQTNSCCAHIQLYTKKT